MARSRKRTSPDDDASGHSNELVYTRLTDRQIRIQARSDIENFLNLCIRSSSERETRTLVRDFFSIYDWNNLSVDPSFRLDIPCKYLMEVLYKSESVDIAAISRAIYACVRSTGPYDVLQLQYTERIAASEEVPLLEALRGTVLPFTLWDPGYWSELVFYAIRDAHYGFLQFLVKNRECPFPPRQNKEILEILCRNFLQWRHDKLHRRVESEHRTLVSTIAVVPGIKAERDGLVHSLNNSTKSKFERLFYTLDTISTIIRYQRFGNVEGEQCYREHSLSMKCINFIMKTTVEPFITKQDIEQFLIFYGDERHKDTLLESLWNSLRELSPRAGEFCNPRSLKDLCRSKIRGCISETASLPEQVSSLVVAVHAETEVSTRPIPSPLKQFILFYNDDIGDDLDMDVQLDRIMQNKISNFYEN